jgi:D-arabinose 1-dehydrogenase-like Zn-dependent alcohol dehydrogenase
MGSNIRLITSVFVSDGAIHSGQMVPFSFPHVPGHEVIGDVVAVHPSVKDYKVGDRVGAPWQRGFCEECRFCKAGQKMGCEKIMHYNTGQYPACRRLRSARLPLLVQVVSPTAASLNS